MLLTYSIFALTIVIGGFFTAQKFIRSGLADSQYVSAVLYTPEEH